LQDKLYISTDFLKSWSFHRYIFTGIQVNWDAFNATSPISKFLIKKSQKFNAKNGITLVETPFPQIIEWMAVRRSKRNVSVCFYRKCKYPIDSRKKMTPQSGSYSEGCFGLAWQNIKMMRPSSQ